MNSKALPRWIAHLHAVVLGHFWRPCPFCGVPFGGQEKPTTEHLDTIPGGEHDSRIICPVCTDHGVGCLAHKGVWHHAGCEYVVDEEIWPADDTDVEPGRSGPYPLPADGVKTPPAGIDLGMLAVQEAANRLAENVAAARDPRAIRVVVGVTRDDPEFFMPHAGLPDLTLLGAASGPSSLSRQLHPEALTRAAERKAREAAERAAVLSRHAELVADAQTAEVKQLLDEHVPVEADGRLECRGCARIEEWTADGDLVLYWPEAPCPTWKTMDSLNRRAS